MDHHFGHGKPKLAGSNKGLSSFAFSFAILSIAEFKRSKLLTGIRGNVFPFQKSSFSVLSFCKFTKLPNSPDFTGFYWILADSTKIF